MKAAVNQITIQLLETDIFGLTVEGLVVTTDASLSISDHLKSLAGTKIVGELEKFDGCGVGEAVLTEAGDLVNISKVIHTVAPRWGEGSERGKLESSIWNCLVLAETNKLRSIALPPISVGALGFPVESCARIMISRIIDYTFEDIKSIKEIIIYLSDKSSFEVFQAEFQNQIWQLGQAGDAKVRV
jgi:O-acetyl-ADP-ribose deacetylase (regulator of RNase III)